MSDLTAAASADSSFSHYLTFRCAGSLFGVSTRQVIEIITNYPVRAVPYVPDYVQGIINLRGQIIPIIDIRLRLGKPYQEDTPSTCIIILEIGNDRIGIRVDSVCQVTDLPDSSFSPIPAENQQKLSSSMASLENGTVMLRLDCGAFLQP